MSQFGFVHEDASLLSLAVARRPDKMLTVAGYADLDRTVLTKIMFILLLSMLAWIELA